MDKCLFATQIHINSINFDTKYDICLKLSSVSCTKTSLWAINRIDSSGMVKISLVNTEWSLEWKEISNNLAVAYLAHTKIVKTKV